MFLKIINDKLKIINDKLIMQSLASAVLPIRKISILALHDCGNQQSACFPHVQNTKRAACSCIEESRREFKTRIAGISEAIKSVSF